VTGTPHDNSGIAFRNDRKSRDTDRDFGGSATIGGVEYWASLWVKEGKNGSKFLTFSFTPKQQARKAIAGAPFDDDLGL
jgi:hypothetical protein